MRRSECSGFRSLARLIIILLSVGQLSCVHRRGVVPAEPKAVGQTVQDLQYFIGTWQASMLDPRSGTRATLSYVVEPALSGAWLEGRGHSPELELWVRDFWGRDAVSGEIVRMIFDSQGIQGSVRSSGWAGDVLVLEGDARTRGGVVRVRETITRADRTTFGAVWEMQVDGKWVTYSIEHLKRARSGAESVANHT
jgi:hypothetical protein